MDMTRIPTVLYLVIAAVIAIMWVAVQGTPAVVVSIIGGVAMGAIGILTTKGDRRRSPNR